MRLSAISLALLVLGPSSVARAAEEPSSTKKTDRLAVLPIVLEGEHGSATISGIFNDVVFASEMRLGLRVISYEEMFAVTEEGLGDRVRDCGSDVRCIASRLRTFNARLGLVVVLDFGSKPPLINLQLLDTDSAQQIASSAGEIRSQISENIRARTSDLLEKAGYGRAGRVLVEVTPPNARISLGEGIDPDPGTPNRFTVAPGRYQVTAGLDGWSSEKSDAVVIGGTETKVQLALVKQTTFVESPWFWIAVGAAAVGGTAALVAATHKSSRCVCATLHNVGCDPCNE